MGCVNLGPSYAVRLPKPQQCCYTSIVRGEPCQTPAEWQHHGSFYCGWHLEKKGIRLKLKLEQAP